MWLRLPRCTHDAAGRRHFHLEAFYLQIGLRYCLDPKGRQNNGPKPLNRVKQSMILPSLWGPGIGAVGVFS